MARTNKCKECGCGPELAAGVEWVGTNHNLCSECVKKRQAVAGGRGYGGMSHYSGASPRSLALLAGLLGSMFVVDPPRRRGRR